MKLRIGAVACVATALLFSAAETIAATITLDATDSGFVTEFGGSAKGDGTVVPGATYNYSVGRELHYLDGSLGMPPGTTPLVSMDRNNYFVFDLSLITDPIVSVTLSLPAGLYESVDATEIFDLVAPIDVGAALGDIDDLAIGNTLGVTEFDEPTDPLVSVASALYGNIEGGAGSLLGSAIISAADDFTTITIPFDPGGVGYVGSFAGGPLVLGGSIPTAIPPGSPQQPFGGTAPGIGSPPGTDPSVPMLIIETVPEPSTFVIAAIGMGLIATLGWRQKWN